MASASNFVVLDIGLPDLDGFDVCREIRKSSSAPILFLTARTEEIDRVVSLELGAGDYLAKAFRLLPGDSKWLQANGATYGLIDSTNFSSSGCAPASTPAWSSPFNSASSVLLWPATLIMRQK